MDFIKDKKIKDVESLNEFLRPFGYAFTRVESLERIIQGKNKELCDKFNELTKEQDNSLDKIIALQDLAPEMLENILRLGKAKEIFKL
ncbi:MAG: DUF4474 domain-containing protein [Tissierellia bacterium]|nr:DUF4474 domain-containing protein [Tissierellia bacterium]